jgi:hypothetical protein
MGMNRRVMSSADNGGSSEVGQIMFKTNFFSSAGVNRTETPRGINFENIRSYSNPRTILWHSLTSRFNL